MDGFAAALTPTNLLLALLGVIIGTAVGVLPGIGPALTVALLLPITFTLEPTGRADPVRRRLLRRHVRRLDDRDPAQHTRRERLDGVGARGQQDGQGRAGGLRRSPRPPSAPSWPARIGTLLLTFLAQPFADIAVTFTPADYVALMAVAFVTVATLLGASPLRGSPAC